MRFQAHRQNGTTRALATLIANRYWRAADAERVLEAWRSSGQSGAAFARAHGLRRARLLRWRDRLKRSTTAAFHPVRVVEGARPVAVVASLELELRGGRRIRVHAGFDPELLEELVRTVEAFGWCHWERERGSTWRPRPST
jgi:hypothetical protein